MAATGPHHPLLERCLERIRELPFVVEAQLRGNGAADPGAHPDAVLEIVTAERTEAFLVEAKRTHLTRAIVDGVLAQVARHGPREWILFAPHVGRPLANYLDAQDANFVDLAGNCRLKIGHHHFARIEGRRPAKREPQGRGTGLPGLQVLFALLVRPELVEAPVRTLAEAAGVAPATAANRLAQLRAEGLVHGARPPRRILEPRRLLDLWLTGYEAVARPKLLLGRYRTQETDPPALERHIEKALGGIKEWAFGGGAAAHRLTGFYRGTETVVHAQAPEAELLRRLRALRADDGPLILLRASGPLAFDGVNPRTVAPLLVYAELLFVGDRRAREAAEEIRRKYLEHIP